MNYRFEILIETALRYGESYWSIYKMIQEAYMPEPEKIEKLKVIKTL